MRVRDVMSSAVLSVPANTPVAEARRLMQREQIRHLLVMDATRLEGMVTDRDIRLNLPSPATTLSVWEMNGLLMKLTVAEIMREDEGPAAGQPEPEPPGAPDPGSPGSRRRRRRPRGGARGAAPPRR